MPRIITLSGWGQPHDALATVAPNALHIDYARHHSAQAALLDIANHEVHPDIVIGWSLGGQLAVRAIAAGLLHPRKLVLISTPFQFVKNETLPVGMPADLFAKFRDNYARNPELTLTKAWSLIHKDDSNADTVREHLAAHDKKTILKHDWLRWLDLLESFSCSDLHLADFPPTTIIHGDGDLVVYPQQQSYFANAIPHAKSITLTGCGHAPHWHNSEFIKQAIHG